MFVCKGVCVCVCVNCWALLYWKVQVLHWQIYLMLISLLHAEAPSIKWELAASSTQKKSSITLKLSFYWLLNSNKINSRRRRRKISRLFIYYLSLTAREMLSEWVRERDDHLTMLHCITLLYHLTDERRVTLTHCYCCSVCLQEEICMAIW